MDYTLKVILNLIENRFENDFAFENSFGLARSTVSAWRRGKLKSYKNKTEELAKFFEIDVSEFFEQKNNSLSELDSEQLKLFNDIKSLSPEQQQAIQAVVDSYKR